MWTAGVIVGVALAWRILSFLDGFADIAPVNRVVKGLAVALGLIALLFPVQFAQGTKQFVNRETKALMAWFRPSVEKIVIVSPTTTEG